MITSFADLRLTSIGDDMQDPEVYDVITALFAGASEAPARGDWMARRQQSEGFYSAMFNTHFGHVDGLCEDMAVSQPEEADLTCRVITPANGDVRRIIAYFHGGGFMGGSVDSHEAWCRWLARETNSQIVLVGYRLAPDVSAPIPQEDAYRAAVWIAKRNQASASPLPFVLAGDSSGAGLVAAVALMARDRGGPGLDALMMIQPMLDDRPAPISPEKLPCLTWSPDDNFTAWQALLGESVGSSEVSPYVAPGRMQDLSGLPFTYIEVCELDLFFAEGFAFLSRLVECGVRVDGLLVPGVPHAFDVLAPNSAAAQRVLSARTAFLRSIG